MAVHNQEQYLEAAANSILNQTFSDFEFIIVNDASTDHSPQILSQLANKDKRIKLLHNKAQQGLTKSLNKALKTVKGEYIARMDADDISLPKRLEKQLAYLEKHPQLVLLGTAAYLIDSTGKQIGLKRYPSDHKTLRKTILRYCPYIHSTWMFRRRPILELGGYNPNFLFAQDYELALRLMGKHQAANLPQPLIQYRVASSQAVSMKNLKQQERLALKARLLALTSYGYFLTEAWKLIKPAISYLFPAWFKKIVYQKLYWRSLVLFLLITFSLSACLPQPDEPKPDDSPSSSPTVKRLIEDITAGWHSYQNDTHGYMIKYPSDWQQSQPDSATTIISLRTELEIFVDQANNRNLDNYGEIANLSETYVKSPLTVAGSQAVLLSNGGQNQDLTKVYILHSDYIYRLSWSGSNEVFKQILATFAFTR